MSEPLSVLEQMRMNWFKPDRMIVVYFAVTEFDQVGTVDPVTGNFRPYFKDLPYAKQDCDTLRKVLDYYKIDETHDKVFDLDQNPTEKEFDKVYHNDIANLLQEGKKNKINYLTIFLFAGHGIIKDGMQCLVLNEYDPQTKFYKLLRVEEKIRLYGAAFQNSYNIAIFACCRDVWDHNKMFDTCVQRNPEAMRGIEDNTVSLMQLKLQKKAQKGIISGGDSRGGEYVNALSVHKNFILLFGCRPQLGVKAKTKMVHELMQLMRQRYNRDTLCLKLPDSFEHLQAEDAEFEMVTSNTIQSTMLIYNHNIVTKKIVYIFVNSAIQLGIQKEEW